MWSLSDLYFLYLQVEIDPAGCSYNPDVELHQEAVAAAVAAENRKLLDKASEGLGFVSLLYDGCAAPRTLGFCHI